MSITAVKIGLGIVGILWIVISNLADYTLLFNL